MIPTDAVRKALAAHLATRLALPSSAVLPDWAPSTAGLPRAGADVAAVAVTVIDAGVPTHTPEIGARLVSSTPGAGAAATAVFRTGAWSLPLAVDVWCASRKARADRIAQVWAALNEPPTVSGAAVADAIAGLTLPIADYFGAPCAFDCEGWDSHPSPEGTDREEWRATFQVVARVDDLTQRTITRLVSTSITVAASPTTDP